MSATKNSVATARLGAETVSDIAQQIVERVAFAQTDGVDRADVQLEIDALVGNMTSAIAQSTFNGDNLVDGVYKNDSGGTPLTEVSVVNGIKRDGTGITATTFSFKEVNLTAIKDAFATIDLESLAAGSGGTTMADKLATAEGELSKAISAATSLGITENTLDGQMQFIESLTDTLDSGVSSMVDADMEEEAARLQAYQVQQQLATQSLSIANQAPQNILSLFR